MPKSGMNPALEQLVRSVPPAARVMVEARIETGADLRQRLDQWQQLDAPLPAALELLSNGGIRIKAATANGPASNVVTASARSRNDLGATEPFMDPPMVDGKNRLAALVAWAGSESAQVDLMQILVNLNPQFDLTRPKVVANWQLDLYRVASVDFNLLGVGTFAIQPLVSLKVPATGQTAGLVTFDFSTLPSRPRPKQLKTDGDPHVALGWAKQRPHSLVLIRGLDKDGNPATNIGWGYDGGAATQVSAAGSTLSGQRVRQAGSPGNRGVLQLIGSSASVPAIQFILATHAGAVTTGFTGPGNQITLPAPTPKAQIELLGQADLPPGTNVLYEVQDDAAVWRAFTARQTLDQLPGFAAPTYTTLKERVTLTPNAVGDRSPIVTGLGARAVTTQDLSDICEVQRLEYLVDPQDLHSEVPDLVLRAIHDGERDFRDAISRLLSENPINALSFRLSIGHPSLPRSQWLHLDDFPILEDYDLGGPDLTLQLQSPLVLVRGVLPKLSSEVDAYPIADGANPGGWTKSAATTSFFELLADNQGGIGFLPWDDSTYIVSPNNPATADITVTLGGIGAPNTLAGVLVQFRYAMLSAQGRVYLEVALLEGSTVRATTTVPASGTAVQQGELRLPGAVIASIQNWGNLALRFRAGKTDPISFAASTGQVIVTWARLAVLPQRAPLVYAYPRAIGDVVTDLLANQVGLDARYRGPSIVDATLPAGGLDLASCVTVGKTITAPPGGGSDLLVAKQELDALGDLAGGTWTSEQGRVVFKPCFEVTVDPVSGLVTYTPRTPAPVAVIPSTELEPVGVTPGFKYRVPVFDAFGGYDDVKGSYALEAHGTLPAPLLSSVGPAWLVARRQLDDRSARWIQSQALLNARALRQIQTLGLGQLAWRFRTTYAHPEVSLFDVIAVETDRFLAYDPTATRAIAGLQWVLGFVVGIHNVWGTELTIWIPSYASIGVGAVVQPASQGPPPNLASVFVSVTVVPRAGGFLQVTWSGSPVVQSVRLAAALQTDGGRPLPLLASGLDEAGRLTTFASASPGGSAFLGGASGATPFQVAGSDGAALGSMPSRLLGGASAGQPPAEAGGLYVGRTGAALLGQYAYQDVVLLTVTPYLTPDGSGPPGIPEFLSVRVDVEADQTDPIGGRRRRAGLFDDGLYPLRTASPDGSTSSSEAFNPQASVPPFVLTPGTLSYLSIFDTNGVNTSSIAWTWSAFNVLRPDGSTLAIPASSSFAAAPTPTLSQVAGGGIGATTYQVRIAYVKNGLIYFIGGQASLAVSANFLLKIASPPAVAGYDGWVPLIDTGGTPRPFLETAGLAADGYGCAWKRWLAFGEDYTEPTSGLNGISSGGYQAFWAGAVVDVALTNTTTYQYYPYWDIVNGLLKFGAWDTATYAHKQSSTAGSAVGGREAWADGHIPLVGAPGSVLVAASTPAGGSGSGSGGGGAGGGRFK